MSKQTAQDEDLIILSDDTDTAHSLEDITLDISEESTDSEIITFGEEEIMLEVEEAPAVEEEIVLSLDDELSEEVVTKEVEVVEESVEVEVNTQEAEADFSFDLTSEETVSEASEVKVEEVTESADLDFGGFDLTADENVSDTTPIAEVAAASAGVASMNTILEDTVAKLEARKDAISDEKSGKTAKVTDLKAEIKKLEEQVLTLEGEVEGLDQESAKITLNIESLEDMKLGGDDIAKEHNAQRVKM